MSRLKWPFRRVFHGYFENFFTTGAGQENNDNFRVMHRNCMYNKCHNCKIPKIQYKEDKLQGEVIWFKWGGVVHNFMKLGKEITTKKALYFCRYNK